MEQADDVFEPFFAAGFRAFAFPTQSTDGYLVDRWEVPPRMSSAMPTTITEVVFSRSDAHAL